MHFPRQILFEYVFGFVESILTFSRLTQICYVIQWAYVVGLEIRQRIFFIKKKEKAIIILT